MKYNINTTAKSINGVITGLSQLIQLSVATIKTRTFQGNVQLECFIECSSSINVSNSTQGSPVSLLQIQTGWCFHNSAGASPHFFGWCCSALCFTVGWPIFRELSCSPYVEGPLLWLYGSVQPRVCKLVLDCWYLTLRLMRVFAELLWWLEGILRSHPHSYGGQWLS